MDSENTTKGTVRSPYDRISETGEYLFSVLVVMLAAVGRGISRLFAAADRRFGWLWGKLSSGL